MIDKVDKNLCTGCKMCGDICPQNAITFVENKEGYWYPVVNKDACINCGKCINACPVYSQNKGLINEEKKVYAAWSRNENIRRESTSGGLYYEFAKSVIDEGGYIIGSVYADDFKSAYHTYSNTEDGLKRIMGSKYFQSDTQGIYKKTKELLETGKIVLFTGTPCQINSLTNYLGKEYHNLYKVDFICRGVPSPIMQAKKIELYERENKSKVVFYRDKWKEQAWTDFGELVKFDNGKRKFISRWKDDINDCFIDKNLNLRESCYNCSLKDGLSFSDITIGDFWGINGVTEKDYKLGVSALIVNTERGNAFVKALRDKVYMERRTLQEIKKGNPAYVRAAARPDNRDSFFESVDVYGLKKTVKKFVGHSKLDNIYTAKRLLKVKFRGIIPIISVRKQIDWIQFIKYNFFSKNVLREKDAFLIPCKGSVIQIEKGAKVILKANVLLNYYPCYKRGNQTTLLRVDKGGTYIANNRAEIAYGNTISVDQNAMLITGYFFTGVNTNVICKHKISIGNNVMLGRDVCVFDSDYHSIYDESGERINNDKEVIIEDDVWIGAKSMVLKGSYICSGAIVSANTMVMGQVEENRVFVNKREQKSVGKNIIWER